MLAIIGGSGLTQLSNMEIERREVVRTPYGEPSAALAFGRVCGERAVFLARHGFGHTIPPHLVNYRANIWALKEVRVSSIVSVASVGGIRADLSDPADTARALQQALAGGPITRLVNNVGIVVPAEADRQTLEQFDLAVALNLRCALQCMQALLPSMREAGFGRIVNISSRAALGKELRTAYAATKAGLIGMTRVWADRKSGV